MLVTSISKTENRFFVFEGVNGSGKSSLIDRLSKEIPNSLKTREPGGTPLGEKLRNILQVEKEPISGLTELFLFQADRAHHVEYMKAELSKGKTVLCDRYFYSSVAFQGAGRGIDNVEELSLKAIQGLFPACVFLLDLDPLEGLKRRRGLDEVDRFESEELDFHRRVRQEFLRLAKERAEPFIVIDATESKEKIFQRVYSIITSC
jgi:dTMP kinase